PFIKIDQMNPPLERLLPLFRSGSSAFGSQGVPEGHDRSRSSPFPSHDGKGGAATRLFTLLFLFSLNIQARLLHRPPDFTLLNPFWMKFVHETFVCAFSRCMLVSGLSPRLKRKNYRLTRCTKNGLKFRNRPRASSMKPNVIAVASSPSARQPSAWLKALQKFPSHKFHQS